MEEAAEFFYSSIPFFLGCGGECFAPLLEQVKEVAALCLEVVQERLSVSIFYSELVLEGLSCVSGKLSFGHGRIVEESSMRRGRFAHEQENYSRRLESNSQFL